MTTAVYRPRERDVLLIGDDGAQFVAIARDELPDLVDALCDAFGLPSQAHRLATPFFEPPARDFMSAV
ncbi:hypothetical protein M9978_08180 [Sphingomonas sp. MG17]|uniref:Uncharacterized protein n=1 Tax=Sphingomonas tagetis TaxID=2949092 RepID=A0A9X2KKD2_9SPHN|nr:hypothetical protein [Sphingomonas tagetis]MCP3730404.1 hypothetical protein [Sphingomonas tagetis]